MTTDAPTIAHPDFLAHQLRMGLEFFDRTTSVFTAEHENFSPQEGLMSVMHQVAHVADTFDWFHDALVDMQGFDMDFDAMMKRVGAVSSLAEARAWLERSHGRMVAFVEGSSPESMGVCLPETDPIIAGAPRATLINATLDHTAHHRGYLAVYARLAGLVPPMPYGEMPG